MESDRNISKMIEKFDLFDSNCMVGRTSISAPRFVHTANEFLGVMDEFGIKESLVYHSFGKEYEPAYCNKVLAEEIADIDRLHPVWVVEPSWTGEIEDEKQLVKNMLSSGVKAARIFPAPDFRNFSLKKWCSGRLLGALEEKLIPLFIDIEQIETDTVFELCTDYPKLPIVLAGVGYRYNRMLYPLWEKFENLYTELSVYYVHRGIEELVKRFGPHRLLFGTNLPWYTPWVAVAMLSYARISDSDKKLIAGDNLRNLLNKVGDL